MKKCIGMFRKIILLMLSVLTITQAVHVHAKQDQGSITIDVKAGYEGMARLGFSVPFEITVSNSGEDIEGEIQVAVPWGYDTDVLYATPVSLPSGSVKDIAVNIPINSADRSYDVKLVVKGKVHTKTLFEFKKIIHPDTPVIGVLSDDPEALRELSGIKTTRIFTGGDPYEREIKMKMMVASSDEKDAAMSVGKAELIYLEYENFPHDLKSLSNFNIIVLANMEVSLLEKSQLDIISKWVSQGNILIIGTGSNLQKVYNPLPYSLKPFDTGGTKMVDTLQEMGNLIEKEPPAGSMEIADLPGPEGKVLLKQDDIPLAVISDVDSGIVTILAYDPTLEPLAGWSNSVYLWEKLINDSVVRLNKNLMSFNNISNHISGIVGSRNYRGLVNEISEEEAPPYRAMLIIIGVYILLVGPAFYIILKKKDRRDWNWIAIPAASLLFLLTIYLAGFKTRYTTAILNNVSVIEINEYSKTASINTYMGMFNNRKGDLSIKYDPEMNLDINPENQYYEKISYRQADLKRKEIGKITFGAPIVYDMYNVGIWEARYMGAKKSMPVAGGIIDSFSLYNDRLEVSVNNRTPFYLQEAFISIGNSFIEIGDLMPGDRREINADLDGDNVEKSFQNLMRKRYSYNVSQGSRPPKDWREKNRKQNLFNRIYDNVKNNSYDTFNNFSIHFYALNYNPVEYDITINDKEPKVYNSNIVYYRNNISFEKGSKIHIPFGIMKPVLEKSREAYLFGGYADGVQFEGSGDAEFCFTVPDEINVDKFSINMSKTTDSIIERYRSQENKDMRKQNKFEFYIYNKQNDAWEEFKSKIEIEGNADSYIDENNKIRMKISAQIETQDYYSANRIGIPEFAMEGMVK